MTIIPISNSSEEFGSCLPSASVETIEEKLTKLSVNSRYRSSLNEEEDKETLNVPVQKEFACVALSDTKLKIFVRPQATAKFVAEDCIKLLLQAYDVFHGSKIPKNLLNREEECRQIEKFIRSSLKAIENATFHDSSMYISGVPGTGKTATATQVIKKLRKKLKFSYVYVNALELVHQANFFVEMHKQLLKPKRRLPSRSARQHLSELFHAADSNRKPVVLVIDELDMLCNKAQDVIYDVFDWCAMPESKLIILSIANTLDLPERMLKSRISSRMGLTRVVFQPYTFEEIANILQHRLPAACPVKQSALELIGRKVAAVSGDLRKAFELTRRALELAIDQGSHQLNIDHVMAAHLETQQSLINVFVGTLSLHQEILLRQISREFQETGFDEIAYSSTYQGYRRFCLYQSIEPLESAVAVRILDSLQWMGFVEVKVNGLLNRWIRLRLAAEQIDELLVSACRRRTD